jgi:DNA-directed RNA polymerase
MSEAMMLQSVAINLADALITHHEYVKFKAEAPNYLKAVERNLNGRTMHMGHRKTVIMRAKRKLNIEDTDFDLIDRTYIGTKLIELFIEATGFVKRKRMQDSSWMLDATEKAKEWIEDQNTRCELLHPEFLPMIVTPVDWKNPYSGGYLTSDSNLKVKLVKTYNHDAIDLLEAPKADMSRIYKAVNSLQKTRWVINKRILEVMEKAWEMDNGLGGIPTEQEEPVPATPWGILSDAEFKDYKEKNPEIVTDWKNKARDVYNRRVKNKSKRIQFIRKLWVADKFKDEEEIFFVYILDWRGRVYPIQKHINPQADDVGKALLQFAEGKPLSKRGAYWLKVHLANSFGEDKISFEDRVKWTEDNSFEILASAKDPFVNRFWEDADDPWAFLSACFEYLGYITEGVSYESHLPIAMDGSCNGIQNFAGMLKDTRAGEAVNLMPAEVPQDVYQRVADRAEDIIKREAVDPDNKDKVIAQSWVGKITRKIVKRPVMTMPYGVTPIGMREQIQEVVTDLDEGGSYLGDHIDNYQASYYLAKKIEESLGEVVYSASRVMDWLKDVVKVANEAKVSFFWETPAGFRPYQDYKKQKTKRVETFWGSAKTRVRLSVQQDLNKLNTRKQTAGISPNFVHSMDASHLMLTVNTCKADGVNDFAMIHDSYGTHACDTDKLHEHLRAEFVNQYKHFDVLENFAQDVANQIPDELREKLPQVPAKGQLDLDKVGDSLYFFA